MTAPIFISYSSKDQKIAETICRALEARGYNCWIAARDVGPGENFQEAIVRALRSARLMILVFTSNANNSNEIKKEVVLAGRHHVTVVPVRVEDVVPNDALAYEFATRQWIDLFTDWEREIERLVSQIGSILTDGSAMARGQFGDTSAGFAEKSVPQAPLEKSPLRPLLVLLPVVAGLALGGAYLYTRPAAQPPSPAAVPASQSTADERGRLNATSLGTVSSGTERFDGTWMITISCSNSGGAQGYTIEMPSQVKDGIFHAQRGTEGKPDWLTMDGKIELDGSAELYAQGLTSASAFTVGNVPAGTGFSYHIRARFEGSSGTGSRVELRPCDFTALKR